MPIGKIPRSTSVYRRMRLPKKTDFVQSLLKYIKRGSPTPDTTQLKGVEALIRDGLEIYLSMKLFPFQGNAGTILVTPNSGQTGNLTATQIKKCLKSIRLNAGLIKDGILELSAISEGEKHNAKSRGDKADLQRKIADPLMKFSDQIINLPPEIKANIYRMAAECKNLNLKFEEIDYHLGYYADLLKIDKNPARAGDFFMFLSVLDIESALHRPGNKLPDQDLARLVHALSHVWTGITDRSLALINNNISNKNVKEKEQSAKQHPFGEWVCEVIEMAVQCLKGDTQKMLIDAKVVPTPGRVFTICRKYKSQKK